MSLKILKKILTFFPFFILLALPIILTNFKQVSRLVSRAFYHKARLTINTTTTQPNYLPKWLSFAQGGEEPGINMLSGLNSALLTLKPKYIRLDHIFDDDFYGVVKRGPQNHYFDFTKLDEVVFSITNSGATPFLVLSYTPSFLNPEKTGLPDDWPAWQNLVRTTIEHYSGYNAKNIPNIYYEVWNEPDLETFGGFKYYGAKNYLTLYRYSALGAAQTTNCNRFKIGGPATTALYPNWITALLDLAEQNQLPLDFLSYHQYSAFPDEYQESVDILKQSLKDYPQWQNIEIVLSEWGPDSDPNPIYNSQQAAAFTLSTISELNHNLDMALAFEIKDGPTTNSWGMIGHENQNNYLKPRYHVYRWLAELPVLLSHSGNGTYVKAIAGQKNNTTTVFLSNYDPNATHQELSSVRFINLTPGRYQLTKQYLGGSPGTEEIETSSSVYSLEVYLPPNAVCRLDLVPL